MGIFDRIRSAIGGGAGDLTGGAPRVDLPAAEGRLTHGAHWETVGVGADDLRETIATAVESGSRTEGRSVDGETVVAHEHPARNPVRACALSVGGRVQTAFPVGNGVAHDVSVARTVDYGGIQARSLLELAGGRLAAFDATQYRIGGEGERTVELAAFAYDCDPAETERLETEDGDEFSTEGRAALVGFDGGNADDYVFRSTVRRVETTELADHPVYRMRLPLFRTLEGQAVDADVYVAESVAGFVPEAGQDVEGVCWLQCRTVE